MGFLGGTCHARPTNSTNVSTFWKEIQSPIHLLLEKKINLQGVAMAECIFQTGKGEQDSLLA